MPTQDDLEAMRFLAYGDPQSELDSRDSLDALREGLKGLQAERARIEGVSRDANLVLADILAREPREGAVNTAIALLEEWEGWLGADQFVDAARDVLRRHRDGVALSGSTGQGGGHERSGDRSGQ